jgi:hypothetical protein
MPIIKKVREKTQRRVKTKELEVQPTQVSFTRAFL